MAHSLEHEELVLSWKKYVTFPFVRVYSPFLHCSAQPSLLGNSDRSYAVKHQQSILKLFTFSLGSRLMGR